MLNWRLSLPSLRRCRSGKSDRDPKEESLSCQDGQRAAGLTMSGTAKFERRNRRSAGH